MIELANIATAISQLSISGVNVKNKDEVLASWIASPNVLFPNPDGWITDFNITYDALMQGTTAPLTIAYTMNYRFLGVAVGDLSTFPVSYSLLVDKVALIIDALIGLPAPYNGKIELIVGNISLGARTDPAGNNYFGADIPLSIKEMHN